MMCTTKTSADDPGADPSDGGPAAPGTLQRLVVDLIAEEGISVRSDGYGLTLNPGPGPWPKRQADTDYWFLSVDDDAQVRLKFAPGTDAGSDPRRIADIATALLTGVPGTGRDDSASSAAGLKEAAGLLLRARGFRVELNTYVDDTTLSLGSDVSATTADTPRWDPDISGAAFIADNGSIDFARPFWNPDATATARAIAATVTAAIRAAKPGPTDVN